MNASAQRAQIERQKKVPAKRNPKASAGRCLRSCRKSPAVPGRRLKLGEKFLPGKTVGLSTAEFRDHSDCSIMPKGANKIFQFKSRSTAPYTAGQVIVLSKEKIMISKFKLVVIAAVTALSIGVPTAALAQSAWTTGTASNRAAAGYAAQFDYPR